MKTVNECKPGKHAAIGFGKIAYLRLPPFAGREKMCKGRLKACIRFQTAIFRRPLKSVLLFNKALLLQKR